MRAAAVEVLAPEPATDWMPGALSLKDRALGSSADVAGADNRHNTAQHARSAGASQIHLTRN